MSADEGLDVLFLSTIMAFKDKYKLKNITAEDAALLMRQFKNMVKKLDKDKDGIPHEWVIINTRGRVLIPQRIRNIVGIVSGDELECKVFYENSTPKGIILTKFRI